MTSAHDLLLALLDVEGGLPYDGNAVDLALAGATLCDLAASGAVLVDKSDKVQVVSEPGTSEALLAGAYERFAEKDGKKAASVLPHVAKGLRDTVLADLERAGVVRHETSKSFGVFTKHRWPLTDPQLGPQLRGRMVRAVESPQTAAGGDVTLAALASAAGAVPKVFKDVPSRLSGKELREGAKAIAEGEVAGVAVSKAVQQAQAAAATAATTAAVAAATVTTTN